MVMYLLAIRHWVNDMNSRFYVASIDVGSKGTVDVPNVRSVNCLMNKKAMPIKKITFKYRQSDKLSSEELYGDVIGPILPDETLGETLARCRSQGESLHEAVVRRRFSLAGGLPSIKPKEGVRNSDTWSFKRRYPQCRSQGDMSSSKSILDERKRSLSLDAIPLPRTSKEPSRPMTPPAASHSIRSKPQDSYAEFIMDEFDREDDREEEESETDQEENAKSKSSTDAQQGRRGSDISDSEVTYSSEEFLSSEFSHDSSESTFPNRNNRIHQALKSCLKVRTLAESLSSCSILSGQQELVQRVQPAMMTLPSSDVPPGPPRRRVSCSTLGSMSAHTSNDYQEVFGHYVVGNRSSHLRWGRCEVREYSQCLGDNPACSDGAPIQLNWDYQFLEKVSVDEYETRRKPSRRAGSLRMSRRARHYMLLDLGFSTRKIALAIQTKQRDQKRRIQTVSQLTYHMVLKDDMEKRTGPQLPSWRKAFSQAA